MKRNMLAKKLTAALLTGTMVMSMGMTAFAATQSVTITKKVTTDGKTYAPNTTFNFKISQGESGTITGEGEKTVVVYAGEMSAISSDDISISFADNGSPAALYDENGTFTIDPDTISKPGVFHYTIAEVIPTGGDEYEGIVYDETEYDMYVYVTEASGVRSVEAITVGGNVIDPDSEAEGKVDAIEFTNVYGAEDDDEKDEVYDLIITKVVTGNQGEKGREFAVDITIINNGDDDEKNYYAVKYSGEDEEHGEVVTFENGVASEGLTLTDGESIHIYGLTENDTFKVDEENLSSDGYTVTYTAAGGAVENPEDDGEDDYITGKVNADGATVTITNDKDVISPTGIAMTFAPYAVMVAFAGVFAVMFLRKKREDF